MPTYRAIGLIGHNGKNYHDGDLIELTEAQAAMIPHAVRLVEDAPIASEPIEPEKEATKEHYRRGRKR